jgi:predicted nucleic acid-binding protein
VYSRVLVDTGPLVAIIRENDSLHEACTERLQEIQAPLLTCWPVITEAAWFLRDNPSAIQELLLSFNTGFLQCLPMDEGALSWIAAFFRKYRKLSPQLADAALVYLAESENLETIFTLDRGDFSVYRLAGGRSLHIL